MIMRVLLSLILFMPTLCLAEQKIELKSSTIKGNSELPKILYVVPWKKVAATEIKYKLTVHGISDDVMKPIDPEEFRRQAKNHAQISNSQKNN